MELEVVYTGFLKSEPKRCEPPKKIITILHTARDTRYTLKMGKNEKRKV